VNTSVSEQSISSNFRTKYSVRTQWVRPIQAGYWENGQRFTAVERRQKAVWPNKNGEHRGCEENKTIL
jgi:hypothetical protein